MADERGCRVEWIDAARGLGIMLMVAGHVAVTPRFGFRPDKAIYLFHMPLFVFLTAMVTRPEAWSTVARRRGRSLLLPYASYLLLLGAPMIAATAARHGTRAAVAYAVDLALGGTYLKQTFVAFWYLPALFVALVVFSFLHPRRASRLAVLPGIVVAVCTLGAYAISLTDPPPVLPYALTAVPAMISLLWMGTVLPWERMMSPLWFAADAAMLLLSAAIARTWPAVSFAVDLRIGIIGAPVIGLGIAVALSHLTFVIAHALGSWPLIGRGLAGLGRLTLPILFLHILLRTSLLAIGIRSETAIGLVGLILPIIVALAVRHVVPWAAPYLGVPDAPSRVSGQQPAQMRAVVAAS